MHSYSPFICKTTVSWNSCFCNGSRRILILLIYFPNVSFTWWKFDLYSSLGFTNFLKRAETNLPMATNCESDVLRSGRKLLSSFFFLSYYFLALYPSIPKPVLFFFYLFWNDTTRIWLIKIQSLSRINWGWSFYINFWLGVHGPRVTWPCFSSLLVNPADRSQIILILFLQHISY